MNDRDSKIITLAQQLISAIRYAEQTTSIDADGVRQALGIANSVFESGENQKLSQGVFAQQAMQAKSSLLA